jgi:uncharacterized protein (TIGR03086 family)
VTDIVELDRQALAWTADLLAKAQPTDWSVPTPCGEWNLRQLTEHMVAQNKGFAAASAGGAREVADWAPRPLDGDPHAAFVASATETTAAFRSIGEEIYLAEFGRAVPGKIAMGFHFVDYLAHGWDVARALGLPDEPDPALTEAGMAIAERIPNAPPSRGPGAAFAYIVEVADTVSPHQRLIALLGRSPQWTR